MYPLTYQTDQNGPLYIFFQTCTNHIPLTLSRIYNIYAIVWIIDSIIPKKITFVGCDSTML